MLNLKKLQLKIAAQLKANITVRNTQMKIIFTLFIGITLLACTKGKQHDYTKYQMAQIMHPDSVFKVNDNAIESLELLKVKQKFCPEEHSEKFLGGYVGLLPKHNQPNANLLLNSSIDRIIEVLKNSPTKEKILKEYEVGLQSFDEIAYDTEDRERVAEYYDEIREIIGFDNTNGVINKWLYW